MKIMTFDDWWKSNEKINDLGADTVLNARLEAVARRAWIAASIAQLPMLIGVEKITTKEKFDDVIWVSKIVGSSLLVFWGAPYFIRWIVIHWRTVLGGLGL